MDRHVLYSYKMLKKIHPFSAEISLLHHYYQLEGYPKKLPKRNPKFSPETWKKIEFYAKILAIADVYDAATTRPAKAHGFRRPLAPAEAKACLIKKFMEPEQRKIINCLYRAKIFGKKTKIPSQKMRAGKTLKKRKFPAGKTIVQTGGGRIVMRRIRR
ncbi:MAG: hypothetical protein NTZ73_01315 [Candidatus Diapherotrites archaeon]|nr:hypothetical protein [Candidatus Diapherotrites archaeon]